MRDSSDARNALEDIFKSLQGIFKHYNRSARKNAWQATISTQGKNEVDKLINSPTRQLVGIRKLLSFKEWFNHS